METTCRSHIRFNRHVYRLPVLKVEPYRLGGLISETNIVCEHPSFIESFKWNDVLGQLSYREREIIKMRFGFDDGYTYTLAEIGRIFKVTRERVRQVEAKAIRKLQSPSIAHRLLRFFTEKV